MPPPRYMNVGADCLEVFSCNGPSDGQLVGYAIRWTGKWFAFRRVPGWHLRCVGLDLDSAEEAVKLVEATAFAGLPG